MLAATLVVWLTSTWGMAVVIFMLAWWASYLLFGSLREGLIVRGVRNPFSGFGEEHAPQLEDAESRS